MVRGFSRFVLFLFLGLLRAPTRNSPDRLRDTIWTFPEKSGKHPGLATPRLSFSQSSSLKISYDLKTSIFVSCWASKDQALHSTRSPQRTRSPQSGRSSASSSGSSQDWKLHASRSELKRTQKGARQRVRESETTIKIKFAFVRGGGERKIVQNAIFRGKRPDNKILKVKILLSRNFVFMPQAPKGVSKREQTQTNINKCQKLPKAPFVQK